jgi:anti-anti-sigma regulatory factor
LHACELTIELSGSIDSGISGEVSRFVADVLAIEGVSQATIDLSRLHGLDEGGALVLRSAAADAALLGVPVRSTGARWGVRRALRRAGCSL